MNWNGLLEKIGSIEFNLSPNTGQGASVNIRIEGNDYNFPIKNPEQAKKLPQMRISQEFKDEIKARARERLASMEDFLDFVDQSTAKKIVLASAALATFDTIQKAIS